jgi:hypothetical protein
LCRWVGGRLGRDIIPVTVTSPKRRLNQLDLSERHKAADKGSLGPPLLDRSFLKEFRLLRQWKVETLVGTPSRRSCQGFAGGHAPLDLGEISPFAKRKFHSRSQDSL